MLGDISTRLEAGEIDLLEGGEGGKGVQKRRLHDRNPGITSKKMPREARRDETKIEGEAGQG